jgi:hypothetical protein
LTSHGDQQGAEITNLIQVPWRAAKLVGFPRVFDALSAPMTFLFIATRIFILPAYFFLMLYETVFFERESFGDLLWLAYFTIFIISLIMVGGFFWARDLIRGYLKSTRKAKETGKTKAKDKAKAKKEE